MWPAIMVQQLVPQLPENFTAEPRVHLGSYFEIDVSAYERDEVNPGERHRGDDSSGVATMTWAPPQPTQTFAIDLTEQYEYEVLVYDQSRNRKLVAAVEIVSPANKDRPENRRTFATKCAALLQQHVCVAIVDLVTTRSFNLCCEMFSVLERSERVFAEPPPNIYAVVCRGRKIGATPHLEAWAYPFVMGEPLPLVPLWLTEDFAISLDLEAAYETTCRILRIA